MLSSTGFYNLMPRSKLSLEMNLTVHTSKMETIFDQTVKKYL